jgi:tetratricopeptide (TPR) repeat protein
VTAPRPRSPGSRSGEVVKRGSRQKVSLIINTDPADARVFVADENSEDVGYNPVAVGPGKYQIELWPKSYRFYVNRQGYYPVSAEINIAASPLQQEVDATLVQMVTLINLNVKTNPPEVELTLDGEPKGVSGPDGRHVLRQVNPTQEHKLRGRKYPGYTTTEITVPPGTTEIGLTLPSESASLKVITDPPEAEVYLNDAYKGTSNKEGLLMLEGINPSRTHALRAEKRPDYASTPVEVQPNSPEVKIKLLPDPIVARSRALKQHLDSGRLAEAFNAYNALSQERPDYEALPRLLDAVLQLLLTRSTNMIAQVGPYGLQVGSNESREMSQFYEQARLLRPGDSAVAALAEYWKMKSLITTVGQSSDPARRASMLRNTAALASVVDVLNPQNAQVLFDSAWVHMKAGDSAAAKKGFELTQRLNPSWGLPYFALGLMDMNVADQERVKAVRTAKYQEAIVKFSKAIDMKPDFFHAYALRCFAYATINMYYEAIANGQQAVAMRPQSAYAHYALGFAYFQKGKQEYRNSLSEFERALSLKEDELDEATKLSVQQKIAIVKKSLGIKS